MGHAKSPVGEGNGKQGGIITATGLPSKSMPVPAAPPAKTQIPSPPPPPPVKVPCKEGTTPKASPPVSVHSDGSSAKMPPAAKAGSLAIGQPPTPILPGAGAASPPEKHDTWTRPPTLDEEAPAVEKGDFTISNEPPPEPARGPGCQLHPFCSPKVGFIL